MLRHQSLSVWRIVGRPALTVLTLFWLCAASAVNAYAQDSQVADVRTTFVVGDLHGDFEAYDAILQAAGLIDEEGDWTGGASTFVQIGDIPDRGPDSKKIIEHIRRLERQARRAGGEVIPLLGNHEAMNVLGDLRYVHPGEYEAFVSSRSVGRRNAFFANNEEEFARFYRRRDPDLTDAEVRAAFDADYPLGYVEHRKAWSRTGSIGGWVIKNDAIRIIDKTLFVHAGISRTLASKSVDELNSSISRALRDAEEDNLVVGENSPLWFRGHAMETDEGRIDVEAALDAYDVDRIVIGHTPQKSGIRTFYGGRVVAIDTGISRHYGGTRSYLRIEGKEFIAVDDGVERRLAPLVGENRQVAP